MLKKEKHSKNFSRPIVLISILGVALGVCVIVLTISIATGFQNQVKNKLLSFGSHIQIESMFQSNNNETSPINLLNDSILSIDNEYSLEKYAYKSAIIQLKKSSKKENNEVEGVLFKGLENFQNNRFLNKYITTGTLPKIINKTSDTIVLSRNTCMKLNIKLHDKVSTFFISNGKPRQRNMILGAIYETGLDKVDSKFGFVDIKLLKKINNWGLTLSTTKEFNADSSFLSISVNNISKNGSFLFDWGNNSIVTNNKFQFSTKKDTSIELITYEVNNSKDQNLINIPDTLTIIYTSKYKEINFKNTEGSGKYFCGGIELYLENFYDRNR